jgi:hypothetical protein
MEVCVSYYDLRHSADAHFFIAFSRIIQLQALVARVVREFQFFEVEDKPVTLWRPGLVVSIVAGEEAKGPQLPLKVSLVHRN